MSAPKPSTELPRVPRQSAEGRLLYIHPYSHPNDFQVPAGLVGLMNAVSVPKIGRYSFELEEDDIRGARCFALDLHWFFSIDALAAITADLKRLNPAAPIIVGGITASFYAQYLIEHYPIDYLVQGDAEAAFAPLIECIFEGRPVPDLPNLHRKQGGPPSRRFQVDPVRYGATDYLTRDWFPRFAHHTRQGHQAYAEAPYWEMDFFHPFLPLNRGCRFPCNFCFGSYQADAFGPGQVERDVDAFERALDAIVDDGELRFVNLIFGTESNKRIDTYRKVLEKRRPLGMTFMFCEIPRIDQVELLLGAFDRCFFDFTNPEEIPFPLKAAGWTIEDANDRLIELARFLDGRADCQANITFMARRPSQFRDRLRRERFETLNLKDNYEWDLPKPNWKTLERKYRPDKTPQAEHFRGVSRTFRNFIVARALAPGIHPILDHPRVFDWHPNMTVEVRDPGLAALRERFLAEYAQRAVTTVGSVSVHLRHQPLAAPPAAAAVACLPWDGADSVALGAAELEARFNGVHMTFEGTLPPVPEGVGHRLSLGARVGYGASDDGEPPVEVDLFDVPRLPLWTIDLPPATGARALRVAARVHQSVCDLRVWVDGEEVAEHRWPCHETHPETDHFVIDLNGPPQHTPESIVRSAVGSSIEGLPQVVLLEELLARVAEDGRLAPWKVTLLERAKAWVCWEFTHPQAGRVWIFALATDAPRCFVRGRNLAILYRALERPESDHPELRRVLGWLRRVIERL